MISQTQLVIQLGAKSRSAGLRSRKLYASTRPANVGLLAELHRCRITGDRATSEQFHSEFETDTISSDCPRENSPPMIRSWAQAVLTCNILRWIGLQGLIGEDSPVRHPAKRRRLRTVMQELMYVAARVVESGRSLALKFSRARPAFPSFAAG